MPRITSYGEDAGDWTGEIKDEKFPYYPDVSWNSWHIYHAVINNV